MRIYIFCMELCFVQIYFSFRLAWHTHCKFACRWRIALWSYLCTHLHRVRLIEMLFIHDISWPGASVRAICLWRANNGQMCDRWKQPLWKCKWTLFWQHKLTFKNVDFAFIKILQNYFEKLIFTIFIGLFFGSFSNFS